MGVPQWINLTILLAFLGLLLQVAGYVAPMWIWIQVDSFLVAVGLWFARGCGLTDTCDGNTTKPAIAFGYATDVTYAKPEFNAVRVLETLGLGSATFLLLVLFVYRMGFARWDRMGQLNWTAFCLSTLAWLLILAGVIVYCAFFWPVVGTSPLLSRRSFPWSILMCLLAALCFIIVCVLVRLVCRETSDYSKNAIPTSGDHKIDLNPVTKTGLLSRYFSPSPYQEDRRSVPALSAYYDEGSSVYAVSSKQRLLGPESHRASAIDNGAFQGSEGVSHRHLSVPSNSNFSHIDTVAQRSVPLMVVTDYDRITTSPADVTSNRKKEDERYLLRNHHTDPRFTSDGRPTTNADRLAPKRSVQSGSSGGDPRGSNPYPARAISLPTAQLQPGVARTIPRDNEGEVKGYDPTYLYRPYSEHIY